MIITILDSNSIMVEQFQIVKRNINWSCEIDGN